MLPVLQLGPLAVPLAPLTLIAGIWLGLWLAEREATRLGLDPNAVYNLAFVGLVAGLVGARLAYVARHVTAYAGDPLAILALNTATFSVAEGLLTGSLSAFMYSVWRKLPLRRTLDALAPALAVVGIALALAHLASGDAFGAPARLPWSIYLWDDYRHPSQVYELAAALSVWGCWQRWGRGRFDGFGFLLVMATSAITTIALEAFRGDSWLVGGGWRVTQLGGLIVLTVCLVLMQRWNIDNVHTTR